MEKAGDEAKLKKMTVKEITDKIAKTKANTVLTDTQKAQIVAKLEKDLAALNEKEFGKEFMASKDKGSLKTYKEKPSSKVTLPKTLPQKGDMVTFRGEELRVTNVDYDGIDFARKNDDKSSLSITWVTYCLEANWGYTREKIGDKYKYVKDGEEPLTMQEFLDNNDYGSVSDFSKVIFKHANKAADKPKKEKKSKPHTKATYKGKPVKELADEDCDDLIKAVNERRKKAAKSEKKSKSRPVIEKVAANFATAAKQIINNIPAADIKEDPKKHIAKMQKVESIFKAAISEVRSVLGDDFDKETVNEEFADVHKLIMDLKKKYA